MTHELSETRAVETDLYQYIEIYAEETDLYE